MKLIREEIEFAPPLSESSELSDDCALTTEYSNDSFFLDKVRELYASTTSPASCFQSIRYARRDGNCFYRCASFRLFELFLSHRDMLRTFIKQLSELRPKMLKKYGCYSDDFVDATERLVSKIEQGDIDKVEQILEEVNTSDYAYVLVFFRYAVSLHISENRSDYEHFIAASEYTSVDDYCVAEVEPPDHISDDVQLAAFARLFNVPIQVSVLDRNPSSSIACPLKFNVNSSQSDNGVIYLLYRPGHYDILQK